MKSILRSGMSFLALAGMLMVASPSYALLVDETVSAVDAVIDPVIDAKGAGLTLTLAGLPTNAISDATVSVMVRGDFAHSEEYIDLSVDGLSGGRWLDNDPSNDPFSTPAGDVGNDYGSILSGTTTIGLANLLSILGDGTLNFLLAYHLDPNNAGTDVDNNLNGVNGDFASVRIQYETADVAPVPEPSTMLLLGTGLVGVIAWRKQKGRA